MSPATNVQRFRTKRLRPNRHVPADEICSICREIYNNNHEAVCVHVRGCKHTFGRNCIDSWLASNAPQSNACPLCRTIWFHSGFEAAPGSLRILGLLRNEPSPRPGLRFRDALEHIDGIDPADQASQNTLPSLAQLLHRETEHGHVAHPNGITLLEGRGHMRDIVVQGVQVQLQNVEPRVNSSGHAVNTPHNPNARSIQGLSSRVTAESLQSTIGIENTANSASISSLEITTFIEQTTASFAEFPDLALGASNPARPLDDVAQLRNEQPTSPNATQQRPTVTGATTNHSSLSRLSRRDRVVPTHRNPARLDVGLASKQLPSINNNTQSNVAWDWEPLRLCTNPRVEPPLSYESLHRIVPTPSRAPENTIAEEEGRRRRFRDSDIPFPRMSAGRIMNDP
ncbi:hypothetical protein GQ44DRAFT_761035 [Phaeosphaeriaceae sp. PMI808]|nr:hypothetical protein GQ44DRAFT_761035 [Phaeosphaeriaceae sp. PMI808]